MCFGHRSGSHSSRRSTFPTKSPTAKAAPPVHVALAAPQSPLRPTLPASVPSSEQVLLARKLAQEEAAVAMEMEEIEKLEEVEVEGGDLVITEKTEVLVVKTAAMDMKTPEELQVEVETRQELSRIVLDGVNSPETDDVALEIGMEEDEKEVEMVNGLEEKPANWVPKPSQHPAMAYIKDGQYPAYPYDVRGKSHLPHHRRGSEAKGSKDKDAEAKDKEEKKAEKEKIKATK